MLLLEIYLGIVNGDSKESLNKLNESLLTGLITSGFENLESLNDKIYNSIYNQDKLFYKFDSINKSSLLSVVVSTIQFLIDNPSHNVLVVSKKNEEIYNTFENVLLKVYI